MKKQMLITVSGKSGAAFGFVFSGDERHLPEWIAEGLSVVVIANRVPLWVAHAGLTRPWCWLQDRWQWLRLF